MKKFIENEFAGWTAMEAGWLIATCAIITGLSIYWRDSLMGIVSSVTGVAYTVLAGKGKLSAYFFGVINCILYSIISYEAQYYGETMLNTLYYLPMQFVGFYVWSKHMNDETHEVTKKHMSNANRVRLVVVIALLTVLYGMVLKYMGDALPFVDSFTTMASVIAMVISVKMYAEQWWIWGAVNAVSVYMWWQSFQAGSDNMTTLLMWIVYLATAVIMLLKWEKEAKQQQSQE